jgi:hypothetical protein
MCLSIKRNGLLGKYVYAGITDSLKTIIRNQMLHQWMIYSSEVAKEIIWKNWDIERRSFHRDKNNL